MVVPFVALVDSLVAQAQLHKIRCEEWVDRGSGHEMPQLLVVSADRAVSGSFRHHAQGLALAGQLAHVFFDECHVALTDTSYRTRLRQLWTLRYLEGCPFTCLTATLMVDLEHTFRGRLLLEHALILRRSTVRRLIQYQVHDSSTEDPWALGWRLIQALPALGSGQRGVVYVRSYAAGEVASEALQCPFYKATAEQKSEMLQQWSQESQSWIVATGALGTGIHIPGIVYVVHIGRPYGLTSFAQQSGRGGRGGELSTSIVVASTASAARTSSQPAPDPASTSVYYSVEQADEEALTGFLQSSSCRRAVLARYMDGQKEGASCKDTDSVLCDCCARQAQVQNGTSLPAVGKPAEEQQQQDAAQPSGSQAIALRLAETAQLDVRLFQAMDRLQRDCIYCQLTQTAPAEAGLERQALLQPHPHMYDQCLASRETACSLVGFWKWRRKIDLGRLQQCWGCGLSQEYCQHLISSGAAWWRRPADIPCEYALVMLPGIFILYQQGRLERLVRRLGFPGEYPGQVWKWMVELGGQERLGSRSGESNWMASWRQACQEYLEAAGEEVRVVS